MQLVEKFRGVVFDEVEYHYSNSYLESQDFSISQYAYTLRLLSRASREFMLQVLPATGETIEINLEQYLVYTIQTETNQQYFSGHEVLDSTSSPANQDLARQWLRLCHDHHGCGQVEVHTILI